MAHEASRRRFLKSGVTTSIVGMHGPNAITQTDANAESTEFEIIVLSDSVLENIPVRNGRTLTQGRYEKTATEFQFVSQYTVDESQTIVAFDFLSDGYVINTYSPETGSELVVLDADFNPRKTNHRDGTPAVTATDDFIYTASEDGFFVFDTELTLVGSARLPSDLQGKEMEEVLLHNNTAYIVDDLLYPLYLLKVDITDPTQPRYTEVVRITGVNQTLTDQWIVPEANKWMVVQKSTTMAGYTENVLITPMRGADETADTKPSGLADIGIPVRDASEVTAEQISHQSTITTEQEGNNPSSSSPTGISIIDTTSKPPVYASVETTDDNHYLSSVTITPSTENQITFGTEIPAETPAQVAQAQTTVFALSTGDSPTTVTSVDPATGTVITDTQLEIRDPRDIAVIPR